VLVADNLVFVHVPKTAGTFIQKTLRAHLRVLADWDDAHTPYDELPAEWKHLPAFCVIRNPWDWYVSWFHYEVEAAPRRKPRRWDAAKSAVWEGAMRSGDASFKEAVVRACTGDFEHPLAPAMREDDVDLYTTLVKSITGTGLDRPNFAALRFEELPRSLLRLLREQRSDTPPLRRAIREGPPIRTSRHGPYPEYYDEDLMELVGWKARWVCERFGYTFDQGRQSAI
jgi:hypothetical protein